MSVVISIAVLIAAAAIIFNPKTLNLYYFLVGDKAGEGFGLSGAPERRVHAFHRCDSNNLKRRAAYDKGFARGAERGKHNRSVMNARAKAYANSHTV
jgi:hypothetical protein